VFAKIFTLLTE